MIYYIAEYSKEELEKRELSSSPAGLAKMNYMVELLKEIGCRVIVFSTSRTKNKKARYKTARVKIDDKEDIIFRSTFGAKNLYIFYMERFYCILQLLVFFFRNIHKDDTILVYHEVYYLRWVNLLHRIIKFNLIYEVEELYGFVAGNEKLIKLECKYLKKADSYIFTTKMLNSVINLDDKPYMIVHGVYKPIPSGSHTKILTDKTDKRIHCVYSGTFSPQKGGVYIAARTALFLDENYCIHIAGFGSDKEQDAIKKEISEINLKTSCEVIYEGFLADNEYKLLLQNCDIGLATQDADVDFNSYCFQSKVLMYLSNGLRVVTAGTKVMRTSDINEFLSYYESNSPEAIAKAVMDCSALETIDARNEISSLHKKVMMHLSEILKL